MRLVLENPTYSLEVTIDRPGLDDLSLDAIVEAVIRPALLAAGYGQATLDYKLGKPVDEAFDEIIEAAGL